MHKQRLWFCTMVTGFAAVLFACATPTISELYTFQPVDTEDLSKRFTYGYRINRTNSQAVANSQSRNAPNDFAQMRKELKIYMELVQHCTKGYFVYDETFDGRDYLLHGECQESATR